MGNCKIWTLDWTGLDCTILDMHNSRMRRQFAPGGGWMDVVVISSDSDVESESHVHVVFTPTKRPPSPSPCTSDEDEDFERFDMHR